MRCCASAARRRGAIRPRVLLVLLGLALLAGLRTTTVHAGTPISLHATHAGHVNFVGTAGSLRRGSNTGDACAVDNYDTAPLNDLPAGASVKAAYLYWAGSWSDQRRSTRRSPDWNVTFDGVAVTADRQFTESYGLGSSRYDFFSGMADVTALVAAKGNGLYTFGNLDVNTNQPHCDVQAVLAGWSLIVVYQHPDESNRVVNIFDGFRVYRGGQIAVTASNFEIAASDINGKVGHLTWEGDAENSGSLGGYSESLTFNGHNLLDALNPPNNQFNSTVNGRGSSSEWGVDLDIYDVTPYLSPGDTQATTVYRSGQDLVLLSAEVISVTNIPLTDLTFAAAPDDPLGLFETGHITLAVVNNGPSDEPLPVVLNATLPAGLTLLSATGDGWVLDDSNLPMLSWSHPGPLDAGQSLPVVLAVMPTVAVPATPALAISVGSGSFDFDTSNNFGTVPLSIVAPPAELVTATYAATVSDPVNGTVNPKAIPGATVVYTLTTSNLKAGEVDRNTVAVVSPVPPHTALFVDDFPGTTNGPILFTDGHPGSGLTLGRGNFGNGRPAVFYSDDGGATFKYKPTPDVFGCDAAVTHLRVEPSGVFAGRDATGPSSFSLKFQVVVQ